VEVNEVSELNPLADKDVFFSYDRTAATFNSEYFTIINQMDIVLRRTGVSTIFNHRDQSLIRNENQSVLTGAIQRCKCTIVFLTSEYFYRMCKDEIEDDKTDGSEIAQNSDDDEASSRAASSDVESESVLASEVYSESPMGVSTPVLLDDLSEYLDAPEKFDEFELENEQKKVSFLGGLGNKGSFLGLIKGLGFPSLETTTKESKSSFFESMRGFPVGERCGGIFSTTSFPMSGNLS